MVGGNFRIVGGVTRFAYDGDGTRVQQVHAGGTTLYLGALELFITGTARITKTYYALGSQPVARRVVSATTNTVYWLHGDALGSLVLVTAGAGPGDGAAHTPYGTIRVGGVLPTDRRCTGQRKEVTLGVYDYGARMYDVGLGRFISADSIVPEPGQPQSLNRYMYVLGNPLRYVDSTGHFTEEEIQDFLGVDTWDAVLALFKRGGKWEDRWGGWRHYKPVASMMEFAY